MNISEQDFDFLTKELIDLSTITSYLFTDTWNTYCINSKIIANNSSDKYEPKFFTYDYVKKETQNFWNHDWLLNDGNYYVKLLATFISLFEFAIKDSNSTIDIAEKIRDNNIYINNINNVNIHDKLVTFRKSFNDRIK
tara:strand:- start:329 stop:742 length:414 start_codon:yes stop_codon:yes gene_type:complete